MTYNRRLLLFSCILTVVFIGYIMIITGIQEAARESNLVAFSDGWTGDDGVTYDIADVRVNENGIPPIVTRTLPDDIDDNDCLCLELKNVNVTVYVDDEELFRFEAEENITGLGYGTAFYEIGLDESLAGGTVKIIFRGCNPDIKSTRGHIEDIYLGPAIEYAHMIIRSNLLSIIASVLVIFFGIIFILIGFVISDREKAPFDLAALGVASVLIGLWLLALTNVFQLITGHIYAVRVLNRFLVLVSGVPLVCFFNSFTQKKRRIYPIIEFWSGIFFVALLFVLKHLLAIDMMSSFQRMLIFFILEIVVLVVIMFLEDKAYCRANNIASTTKNYYVGIVIFIASAVIDYALYYSKLSIGQAYGTVTSIGTFILLPVVLIQFIKWWTQNRAVIERERFTNRALHYALSSGSPDESIKLMLEYMGEELKCKRAIVFEDAQNGRYHATYAWFDKSLGNRSVDLLYLPVKGLVDEVLKSYAANDNTFEAADIEVFKEINLNVYNLLFSYSVENVVVSPLEVDGVVTGLLVLLDMPTDALEEASSVARLISYFLSQLILRRDDQKRMRLYRYNDSLSGANNRRAYDEFVKNSLDTSSSFGYLLCQLNDLEEISDSEGMEAGDRLVTETVSVMCKIFGKENVYRMVGSRFVAFGFETDESYFNDDIQRLTQRLDEKGISVTLGTVYCLNGTKDMRTVAKHAKEMIDQGGKHA